jgi:adenine-specific DNA-methyltransferase
MATRPLKVETAERRFQGPAERLRGGLVMARALAESLSPAEQLDLSRALTRVALTSYWQCVHRGRAGIPPLPAGPDSSEDTLSPAACALGEDIGQAAATLEPSRASYAIGRVYAALLPADLRASLGAYYTPPAVVDRLLQHATDAGVDWRSCRVLDPACGGGAFLAPLALRMSEALRGQDPRFIVRSIGERLAGFEIDPFEAWMSQVFVEASLADLCRAGGRPLPRLVRVCDSLREPDPVSPFDLVVGNPPYGRIQLEPALRARYGRGRDGHANLYGLFTDLALRHASPRGVIAYVTPTSFLGGQYFSKLRELLLSETCAVSMDFIAARSGVFDDVLQETLLATYAKGRRRSRVAVSSVEASGEVGSVSVLGACALPRRGGAPWILPRTADEVALAAAAAEMPHRLSDWGYAVSTGPLVWNRHKDQIGHRPVEGSVPLIWAEAVTADGRFVFRADKKNHAPFFYPESGDDWLLVRKPCVLVQRTTAKEQHRRVIAAQMPASFLARYDAVTVENHLNMIFPATHGRPSRPRVSPRLLAAFLNTHVVDSVFRCISGSVAVSAFELKALPLPPPERIRALQPLLRSPASFEAACARLYR